MRAHVSFIVGLIAASLVGVAHAEELPNADTQTPPPEAAPAPHTAPLAPSATTAKATVTVETATPSYSASTPPVADRPTESSSGESLAEQRVMTGFRLGYLYVFDHKKPLEGLGGQSLSERTGMRSPHQFLIGYEAFYRMLGNSSLNVLLVGNAMISGLEQSRFYPSANGLIGFEFRNSFQLGVGVNVTPLKGNAAHTIVAAGWTPRSGAFYVPIHAFFIPDVDGAHRVGLTTGVTF
jgi:hypothetical protein